MNSVRVRIHWLFCVSLLALAPSAVVAAPEGGTAVDSVPVGMVAHFSGQADCPVGWERATAVEGRIVVGTNTVAESGRTVGVALTDAEDRTHAHPFAVDVNLSVKQVAGANGGNNQGAAAGVQTVVGTTGAATSGLPFIQLLPCVRR